MNPELVDRSPRGVGVNVTLWPTLWEISGDCTLNRETIGTPAGAETCTTVLATKGEEPNPVTYTSAR